MQRKRTLAEFKVRDIRRLMVVPPASIGPREPIKKLLKAMIEDMRTRHVYVVDKRKKLIGVVRMNTIAQFLFPHNALQDAADELFVLPSHLLTSLDARVVEDIMNTSPRFVLESAPLDEVCDVFLDDKINELPVVSGDRTLIGQVNLYEIIREYLNLSDAGG